MKTVIAETWGLCDFRRVGPEAKPPHEPYLGFWGTEVDPGEWANIGDWFALQDGMVSGPYATRQEAREELRSNRAGDFTDDLGRVGRLKKVLHRYKGCRVTVGEFAV